MLYTSFPDGGTDEAAERKMACLVEEHGKNLVAANASCKTMEKELGATAFRFPKAMREALDDFRCKLFELGRMVKDRKCDAADIQIANVMGAYHTICRMAEGWRRYLRLHRILFGAFARKAEKALEKIRQESVPPKRVYGISKERMDLILDLVYKRFRSESGHSFAVHPPQAFLDDPSKLGENLDLMALKDAQFKIVFQDGSRHVLTFHELLLFAHQLIFLAVQMNDIAEKLDKGGLGPAEVHIQTSIAPNEIMRPELAKVLISKIEFSHIPAETI